MSFHYELVLRQEKGNDVMDILFEPERDVPPERWSALEKEVSEKIHKALHVHLKVKAVSPGNIPRYDLKTKRIIDKRPKEFRRELDRT